jgi:peptidoglycan/xylan/chitin deacetylase (PgdA/CDA1 family)
VIKLILAVFLSCTFFLFTPFVFATTLVSVPVLMFHQVTDTSPAGPYAVSVAKFKEYMQAIDNQGYKTITVTQLSNLITKKKPLPKNTLVLTFDDGWKNSLVAAEVMESHNIKGTFYVCSGLHDHPGYLTTNEIKELSNKFEVGAHSHTHYVDWVNKIKELDNRVLIGEMLMSKQLIEKIIGKPVTSYAWPFGYYTIDAIDYAKYVGFTSTVTVNPDSNNTLDTSTMMIKRITINGNCSVDQFKQMITEKKVINC